MNTFRVFFIFSVIAIFLTFKNQALAAPSGPLNLQVTPNETLLLSDSEGKLLAEIQRGTVSKEITAHTKRFLISFGRDAQNRLSAVLAPSSETASPLEMLIDQKRVRTDGNAIVILNFSKDLSSISLDCGPLGSVWIDNQPIPRNEVVSLGKHEPTPATEQTPSTFSTSPSPIGKDPILQHHPSTPDVISSITQDQKPPSTPLASTPSVSTSTASTSPTPTPSEPPSNSTPTSNSVISAQSTSVEWIRSVTPQSMELAKSDEVGKIRLVEVFGKVTAIDPQSSNTEIPVTNGMLISQNAVITTGPHSTVAAILGGTHSVRVVPETDVSFSQSLKGNECQSEVSLKKGSVFAEVNKRKGMTQDFRIKTPVGVAAAKGSKAQVTFNQGRMSIAAAESRWQGTDSKGKFAFSTLPMVSPNSGLTHSLGLSSIPQMDGKELLKELTQDLKVTQEVNQLIQTVSGSIAPPQNLVIHNTFSLTVSNALTLIDGSINPAPLLGALVIPAQILMGVGEPEEKDQTDIIKPDIFTIDPTIRDLIPQPRQTTPGGI